MAKSKGLGELKRYLPRHYGGQVAAQFRCSKSKVYKVVSGRLTDFRILEALLEMANANLHTQKKIEKLNNKIKSNDSNL